jgi:hypothetical protein
MSGSSSSSGGSGGGQLRFLGMAAAEPNSSSAGSVSGQVSQSAGSSSAAYAGLPSSSSSFSPSSSAPSYGRYDAGSTPGNYLGGGASAQGSSALFGETASKQAGPAAAQTLAAQPVTQTQGKPSTMPLFGGMKIDGLSFLA